MCSKRTIFYSVVGIILFATNIIVYQYIHILPPVLTQRHPHKVRTYKTEPVAMRILIIGNIASFPKIVEISAKKVCYYDRNVLSLYNTSDVVILKTKTDKEIFNYRPIGQLWILAEWESALYAHPETYKKYWDQFNYTMTYSRHSDVFNPFGECHAITTNSTKVEKEIDVIIEQKDRLLIWIVSHCITSSQRENYARELAKYLHIDVIGKCTNNTLLCNGSRYCNYRLLFEYKFYLAFENSLCDDYITEKLWRNYESGLVPIVYGAMETYKDFLPKGSYIDVSTFSSPKALAEYILQVNSNETLYRSYFQWRHTYSCKESFQLIEMRAERLCHFVHDHHISHQLINMVNVSSFWHQERQTCRDSQSYLRQLGVTDTDKKPFSSHDIIKTK